MSNDYYANVKKEVDRSTFGEERVEVNQRALIDKILARYASAGAVYRELLQNSNDANATCAEIYFTTNCNDDKEIVTNVTYRNNGSIFRPQDWSRLKKIAEGNPDESKIGAFGVGAYTMFSICEEPMVVSGQHALAFFWKGDALWTKTITTTNRPKEDQAWTSFVLPSRDPYVIPDLVEFGKFLCASLTFTKCLNEIRVYVNHQRRLTVVKTLIQEPTVVQINSSKNNTSSWFSWSNSAGIAVVTTSPSGLFALKDDQSLFESLYHVQVELDGDTAATTARFLSGLANTNISADMTHRMERVTKKKPPKKIEVSIFLSHDQTIDGNDDGISEVDGSKRRNYSSSLPQKKTEKKHRAARRIVQSFSPRMGEGRIFIGFRTSQTTGLAAHLAAPFIPTVEREAMDLQDQTLRMFNLELLDFAGILMRLTLEHSMITLGLEYEKGATERKIIETKLLREAKEAELERTRKKKKKEKNDDHLSSGIDSVKVDDGDGGTNSSAIGSTLFGFAKFMAKGVKTTIKNVVTNISDLVDDTGGGELIYPLDPRPLCAEEHQCIKLMQSFCPRQSTPDPLVGTALAQGFSRCIKDRAPPVLTRSGVVPGDKGRLPNNGMEAFIEKGVIRTVVYQNCEEYHDVIAQCRKLTLDDLSQKLSKDILDERKLIRLIKWWVKFSKIQPNISTVQGVELKDQVRFFLENKSNHKNNDEALPVYNLENFLFYLDKDRIRSGSGYSIEDLPMPDTILPKHIHDEVTTRVLSDTSLNVWFSPLHVDIWIDFICEHRCMTSGQPEYNKVRLQVLSTLGNEHRSRSLNEQRVFGNFCRNLLKEKRCLPFDSDSTEPTSTYAADVPSNLYLHSAELHAFNNIGNFHKVSKSLQHLGVSDDFLLSLGVRKSVAIEFLFENLHTLRYNDDPRPLVEYLRSATLTNTDIQKLRSTQYLPAENDVSRMFSPDELFLPDATFRIFPFVRIMQWPSEDDITERSSNGKFLVSLGMKPLPELLQVLRYVSDEVTDDSIRLCCLEFVAKRLGNGGSYEVEYSRLSDKLNLKFLPCKIKSPLSGEEKRTCYSVLTCCSNDSAGVMGFPTLDFDASKNKMYGNLFKCAEEPSPTALLEQLQVLVSLAKKILGSTATERHSVTFSRHITATFSNIFNYLSSRISEIDACKLNNEEFIPCLVNDVIKWFRPTMVFFQDKSPDDETGDITQSLFQVVDFSPFLSGAGVRQEASTKDIFRRMIDSPQAVLSAVKSEKNYRALLRRVAAHPPFKRVTDEIRDASFLLAYNVTEIKSSDDKSNYELAKAKDIFVIDNSFFGRMFPVKRAPHESDLEDFYALLGANYISKVVRKKFDVMGPYQHKTTTTKALMERISERGPLLLSSSNSSRSLTDNASSIIEQKNLEIIQAPELKAIYSLGKCVRTQQTTCCVRQGMVAKNSLVVTSDFDWFDVGFAIGELILKRCQLEDAFLISSLLETPLDNLRDRGFPVDRIIKPKPPPDLRSKTNQLLSEPTTTAAKISSDSNSRQRSDDGVTLNNSGDETKRDKEEDTVSKSNGTESCSKKDEVQKEPATSKNAHTSMLKQMYPGVDESYLQDKLGDNPNLDKVRSVAEEMAMKGYPKDKVATQTADSLKKEEKKSSKLLGSKKLGKAFNGLKSSNFGGIPNHLKLGGSQSGEMMSGPPTAKNDSVVPADDAKLHTNMEDILKRKVQSAARSVDAKGVVSQEVSINIPEGLDHGSSCEVIPSQDITPFIGANGKSESHNGIKIFSYRKDPTSNNYLRMNLDAVECFAVVLERLCVVFELRKQSVAIYNHHTSNVIAFNAGGALYFNIRYFYRIHYARNLHEKRECYAYWFVVACHELAHNLEGPHNRTHAFYTESYTSLYLPKLMALFDQVN